MGMRILILRDLRKYKNMNGLNFNRSNELSMWEITRILDNIYDSDQWNREELEKLEEEFWFDSEEVRACWIRIQENDKKNLVSVKEILDDYGWLGVDKIWERGNKTLFLVIQHAGLEVQQKYLPKMRVAVWEWKAEASDLALLEDRVAVWEWRPQIYGSQAGKNMETGEYFVHKVWDPEKINERRAEVWLGTIEEYLAEWGLVWDVREHWE